MKKIFIVLLLCLSTIVLNASQNNLTPQESNTNNEAFLNPSIIKENAEKLLLTNEEKEYLKNKKIITVANVATLPPFNFYEDGKPKGYTVDYMKLVGRYLSIEIEFISNKSWDEFLHMLKNKEIDVIPHVAVTKEREEYLAFTNFNHIEYNTALAVNKNSSIKSMKDLSDKVIAVTNNSFLQGYLEEKFPEYTLFLTSSTPNSIDTLLSGESNAVIASLPGLNYYIQKNWLSNIKTISVDDFGTSLKTSFPMAVSKDNQILKSILEKVNSVISYSEINALKQKWMDISDLEYSNVDMNSEEINYLKTKQNIKICAAPDWLPFEQIDKEGNHKGIGADMMNIISKYIGKPIELVATKEWSESLQNIRDRKCDILPVGMNVPSRRDAMNFTKPYIIEPFVIATKMDKSFIKDSSFLNNKKVGIVKGFAFIEVLKEKNPYINVVEVKDTKEGLEKVDNGELFGYIDTMPTISYGIQEYSMLNLKIAGKLEFNIEFSIVSRNDEPMLNTIMQKALDSISEERKRTIINKWVEIRVLQAFDYTVLWQISALFLIVVLAVLYKNRTVILLNNELTKAKEDREDQQKMVNKYVSILSTDTKGIITEVNESYCKATGFSKEELIGSTHSIMRSPAMNQKVFDDIWNVIKKNQVWSGEIKNLKKDKSVIIFNVNIEPIYKDDIKVGYRSISEDITDKKRIEELSVTDKLTGLFNRHKLDELMLLKIEEFKRYKTDFTVILIDIDDFKSVNDTYGHDVGDYVLQKLAKILKENIRITDIVGRWGGEEFVVICNNTNLGNSKILAENIRKTIENTIFDTVGRKTVSLGLSQFNEADDATSIFKKADDALYEAKTTGKNKVCIV